MFLVNSRLGRFSATLSDYGSEFFHPTQVPLLPKLRGQIAEFLNAGSLARLRILSSPTCVGLRYGHCQERHVVFLGRIGDITLTFGESPVLAPPSGTVKMPYKEARGQPTPR